jgi:AbrB family looped-hinge helix DNA binding protein
MAYRRKSDPTHEGGPGSHAEQVMEARGVMRRKGQVTIPADIRAAAHLEENEPVIFRLTPEGVLLQPATVVAAAQTWFWTERWQRMEREAEADIESGRVARFGDADDFLSDLDS